MPAALLFGLAAVGLVAGAVLGLSALEALLLDSRRGVLGTLARAVRLASSSPPAADQALGVAAAVLAVSIPTAAATLVFGSPDQGVRAVAAALLCLGAIAPLIAAVAAGADERSRLGLFDALSATTRRLLALVAVAVAAPSAPTTVLVSAVAAALLVRARHRGQRTLLPRWEDALQGGALLAHRLGERATVVAVAALAGTSASTIVPASAPAAPIGGAVIVAIAVSAVVAARALGPLTGEGVRGPAWLLACAALLRVVLP